MITEDYCSFEVTKLLKEKGFDGECGMTYREHDMQMIYHTPNPNDLLDFTTNRKELEKHSKKQHCDYALCPTHQMALKWLREVHKCYTHICPFYPDMKYSEPPKWLAAVDYNGEGYPTLPKRFDSYEEAVEAALKYTLENLI